MKLQKIIAVVMILTSSILSANTRVLGDTTFPGILCMLGLIGLQRKFTWDIKPQRRIISTLLPFLLLLIFALQYRLSFVSQQIRFNPTPIMAWQTTTRYFLALMILVLFLGAPNKLPASLALYHLANTICAGQLLLLEGLDSVYRPLELVSVILVALYFTSMHLTREADAPARAKPRMVLCYASGVALVVTLNIGWVLGSILYRHQARIDMLNTWFWGQEAAMLSGGSGQSMIGFSGSGRLSNLLEVMQDQDNMVALQIDCDECPGYLRAMVFSSYLPGQSEWVDQDKGRAMFSQQASLLGRHTFQIRRGFDPSKCRKMTVDHRQRYPNVLFSPLGTTELTVPSRMLWCDDDHVVWTKHNNPNLDYELSFDRSQYRSPPRGLRLQSMTRIPDKLKSRIQPLAQTVFAGCETSADKINAVIRYFRENYSYSLVMDIPEGQDKLANFLLHPSTGYCEYFASGTAMLLRFAGVPTRYVTGFLVTEKDPITRDWVAKNENAHAWVEAWNQEDRKWEIVEATPQEDLSAAALDDDANATGGRFILLKQLGDAFYLYGFAGPVVWLFEHNSLLIIIPTAFLLLVSITFLIRRHYARQHPEAEHPQVLRLHQMLRRADHFLKKRGLIRQENETLQAFAYRLQDGSSATLPGPDMARWYLDYAGIRYCREISPEYVQRLSQDLKRLV